MEYTERKYKVAGHVFSVILDAPWCFMHYTPAVAERIARARRGEAIISGEETLMPTRAGDDIPARTFVKKRSERPADFHAHMLDFSQYEPFFYDGDEPAAFSLHVLDGEPGDFAPQELSLIMKIDKEPPFYDIFQYRGGTIYQYLAENGTVNGTLWVKEGGKEASFWSGQQGRPYADVFHIGISLMILFTYATSRKGTLLMHASVIRKNGMAQLFLGLSGTGKSTHSRLWLEAIPECDLVNDDNPALRILPDGQLLVYGTPWSGKTPCYRNLAVPVRAIVRLEQAPENRIEPLNGLQAYASVLASCSTIRWERPIMDAISATAEQVIGHARCFHLHCRPDTDAARLCCQAIGADNIF